MPHILTDAEKYSVKRCLLVDDDEDDREIFCIALKQADPNIQCDLASDGIEALALLNDGSFAPDFIFLDLNMPLMDGKEALKEIRKDRRLDHVPVVIFTTSSASRDREETTRLGAAAFITKPPLISQLADKLLEVFRAYGKVGSEVR